VVTGTLTVLRGAGKTKYVVVETDLPESPVIVTVNRGRIEQILVNLIINAVDALKEVRGRRRRIKVAVEVPAGGDRVLCRIEDNGCGISPAELKGVFAPFFTTKPPGLGTGLGLSVVKQILDSYDGSISVESSVGKGTTFTFDLPAAKGR
jgi:C4-dicarboxylate-specific signal transduction histidine kinase